MNEQPNQPIQPQTPNQQSQGNPSQPQNDMPLQQIQPTQPISIEQPQAPTANVVPQQTSYQQPMQQPYPTTAAASSSGSRLPRKVLVGGIVGLIGVLVIGAVLFMLIHKNSITYAEVNAATGYSTNADATMSEAELDLSDMESKGISAADVTTKASLVQSKVSAAQKQYDLLKKSPVLSDKAVNEKFQTLDKKWLPYLNYIQNNLKDNEQLIPLTTSFQTQLSALAKTTPKTSSKADIAVYITSYKTVLDNVTTKANSVQVIDSVNQQGFAALKAFIQAASQAVATAQTDMNAGKDSYTVIEDLFKVDDAATVYDTATADLYTQSIDEQKKLSPSDQFIQLDNVLVKLSGTLKK